ncbi:hypothetical protein HZ326_5756 [Fusarium oxysporum f. sp. albedinis]|nr:hypothetical protein HZ326_5756 [Fusarium oxysporum f. sp. albedinis]
MSIIFVRGRFQADEAGAAGVKRLLGKRKATIDPMQEKNDEALNQPELKIFGRCWATVRRDEVQSSAVLCSASAGRWY